MLRELQEEITALLEDHALTSGLEIISEDKGDLMTNIKTSLGKLGLVVVVEAITARASKPNLPGPQLDDLSLSITVTENVMLNRSKTDRTAQSVAEDICKALHHKQLADNTFITCGGVLPQDHPTYFICSVPVTLN